jgi:serine/threonine protein kinase
MMALRLGTKLGRYEIRSKIGAGGMSEVYLAQGTKLDWQVALRRTSLSSRIPAVALRAKCRSSYIL